MTTAFISIPGTAPSTPARRHATTAPANPAVLVGGGPADRYRRSHTLVRASVPDQGAPNYARRRLLAAGAAVLVVFGAVSLLSSVAASFGGAPAAAAEASPFDASATIDVAPERHVAAPGDTLWSIASTYRGSVDHDRYVDALIRLNGGTGIEVGQAVRLP